MRRPAAAAAAALLAAQPAAPAPAPSGDGCAPLAIEHGVVVGKKCAKGAAAGGTCTFGCDAGYAMTGSPYAVCDGKRFSPAPPTCALAPPPPKRRVVVPAASTWSLLAWGFDDGGKDNTTGRKVVDIDIDEQKDMIPSLRAAGHIVICYFSSGTLEPFRPDCQANKSAWQAAAVGKMSGWDEEWLDIRKLDAVQALMAPRFDRAAAQGCHGVEPDNIDCYDNGDCWKKMQNPAAASKNEVLGAQLVWNRWQASYAHSLGLAIAMKNAVGAVPQLHAEYDFAVNEQCLQYSECDGDDGDGTGYGLFTAAGKAAFNVEYKSTGCAKSKAANVTSKSCNGSPNNGLCKAAWVDCFAPQDPLPPTKYTPGS